MDEALVLCRLVHYASAMVLFGASLFVRGLAPRELVPALVGPLNRILGPALVALACTAALWPCLAAGQMGEGWHDAMDPSTLRVVLVETAFGRAWQARGVAVLLLLASRTLGGRVGGFAEILSAGLVLASLGIIGHAAMSTGAEGALNRSSQALHLLAAGAWLGGLVPLTLCLRWLDTPDLRGSALLALRRYSTLGHAAVGLVILTGGLNTALILEPWPSPGASPYQSLLCVKIGVVVAMATLALVNRYALVPRLKRQANALAWLRSLTLAELALGIVVTGLVSLFGTLPPE